MKTDDTLHTLLASIRARLYEQQRLAQTREPEYRPFVTISRQAGAGGNTLAKRLVDRLNQIDPGPQPWAVWDRELISKVSAEHQIPEALIESLEKGPQSWIERLCEGLALKDRPTPLGDRQIYRRVLGTMRGLARAGRCVIVGLAGVYGTSDLPGGVHVRLVAPHPFRVEHMAELHGVSIEKAREQVLEIERGRAAFYQQFWPDKLLTPEQFTITLNTAGIDHERQVACLLPLLSSQKAPASATSAPTASVTIPPTMAAGT